MRGRDERGGEQAEEEGQGRGEEGQTGGQAKGGETEWDGEREVLPTLFDLEPASVDVKLTALRFQTLKLLPGPACPTGCVCGVSRAQVEPDGGPEPACV